MMNRFYVSPWFFLAMAAFVMAFTGTLNAAALVVFGLIALALLGRSSSAPRNMTRINHPGRRKSLGMTCFSES